MTIDQDKLHQFLHHAVGDLGAAMSAVLVSIGDELGFYRELAKEALTPAQLAQKTETNERYVREWLNNQAAGGYTHYDPSNGTYYLDEEQALCLANPNGPVDLPGAYLIVQDLFKVRERAMENFRTGQGMEWGEHDRCLFHGTERFFRAGYNANLLGSWIPALGGMEDKLKRGAKVADVGCGHGASTILLAKAFPKSEFVGYDYHEPSVATAQQRAKDADAGNVRFEVADATSYTGGGFDLIAFFDCLHDMADPAGVARHAREQIKPDGTVMLVEPFANDTPQANHNPIGRVMYGASSLICVPVSLAKNGPALGAQAGEKRLSEIMTEAGFTSLRRATETPFNMVLEARP